MTECRHCTLNVTSIWGQARLDWPSPVVMPCSHLDVPCCSIKCPTCTCNRNGQGWPESIVVVVISQLVAPHERHSIEPHYSIPVETWQSKCYPPTADPIEVGLGFGNLCARSVSVLTLHSSLSKSESSRLVAMSIWGISSPSLKSDCSAPAALLLCPSRAMLSTPSEISLTWPIEFSAMLELHTKSAGVWNDFPSLLIAYVTNYLIRT